MVKKILIILTAILVAVVVIGKVVMENMDSRLLETADQLIATVKSEPMPNFHYGISDTVHSDGRAIWFETIGNPADPVVLMIMGLATSAIQWNDTLTWSIINAGYRVVRFDHRDVGSSEWVKEWSKDNAYTLEDMSEDIGAIINKVGEEKIHVIGVSMGGMLAQRVALNYGDNLQSLTLMSTSAYMFDPELTSLSDDVKWHMVRLEVKYDKLDTVEAIKRRLETVAILMNEDVLSENVAKVFIQKALFNMTDGRGTNPEATDRQIEAIKLSGSRLEELKDLNIPTLVLHGEVDPLVVPEHGEKLAAAIPNSKLMMVETYGHIVEQDNVDEISGAILNHLAAHPIPQQEVVDSVGLASIPE